MEEAKSELEEAKRKPEETAEEFDVVSQFEEGIQVSLPNIMEGQVTKLMIEIVLCLFLLALLLIGQIQRKVDGSFFL